MGGRRRDAAQNSFLIYSSMIFQHVGMLQQFILAIMWGPLFVGPLYRGTGGTCLNPHGFSFARNSVVRENCGISIIVFNY